MRMLLLLAAIAAPLWPQTLDLPLRTRDADGATHIERKSVPANRTAIIVCDMWDQHWCSGATHRVAELAGRMNPFLKTARAAGVLIVHAPSDTIDFYKDYPQRAAILKAPHVNPPALLAHDDPPLPIDDTKGGCDTGESFRKAWTRETPLLSIGPEDVISADGAEIYSYLRMRGIETVLIMGVHTNMCVLNRSFAIKQMTRWGVPVVLVRDLTDSMYNPADAPRVRHAAGTELVIAYIEKYWAPTVASGEIAFSTESSGGGAFRWPDGKRVAVSFSFDDARNSQVDVGVPLLDRNGVKATFYVNPPNMKDRLSAWKAAAASGHEIGNHTTSHPCSGNFEWSRARALEGYSPAMIAQEMDGANADIERLLGMRAVTFAYPCGEKFIGRGAETQSYVPLVAKRFLAGRGFRDESANDPVFCDFAQLMGIESDGMSFEDIKAQVDAAAKTGGWVVFAGHDIGAPGRQTTRADALEQFIKFAKDPGNGIWLDTVKAVATYVNAQRHAGQ